MKILLILGIPAVIIIILIIITNFFPSFDDRRKGEPTRAIGIPRIKFNPKWIIILLVLAGVGFLITKIHFSNSVVYPIATDAQEYKLSAGQEVCTKISIGPGITLRFWASKPFSVATYNLDGPTGEYDRPSGESFCKGSNPSGPLVIRGKFDGTVVQIQVVH